MNKTLIKTFILLSMSAILTIGTTITTNAGALFDSLMARVQDTKSDNVTYNPALSGTVCNLKYGCLTIRETPSDTAQIMGGLENGDWVTVYEKTGNFYKIYTECDALPAPCSTPAFCGYGYVKCEFVRTERNNNTNPGSAGASETRGVIATVCNLASGCLTVRDRASNDATILGGLENGDLVFAFERVGDFYRVRVDCDALGYPCNTPAYSGYGYVRADFLHF